MPPEAVTDTPDSAVPTVPLVLDSAIVSVGSETGTVTVAADDEVPPALVAVKVKLSLPRKPAGGV